MAPIGLTPALFALLNVIGAREGAIQQELGEALGIDRSTMVSLIDQLEVRRARQAPAVCRPTAGPERSRSRRRAGGSLSALGGLIAQVEDEVLAGLTAEERRELLALLRRALHSAPAQPLWSSDEED